MQKKLLVVVAAAGLLAALAVAPPAMASEQIQFGKDRQDVLELSIPTERAKVTALKLEQTEIAVARKPADADRLTASKSAGGHQMAQRAIGDPEYPLLL